MLHISGNRGIVRIKDPPNKSVEICDCPDTLYRYDPPPKDQKFLQGRKEIRILRDFASINDSARRDEHEEKKVHQIPDGELPSLPMHTIGYDHPVTARNNREDVLPPPSYFLSFSRVASRELAEKFKGRNGRTASCIKVESPRTFMNELDRVFRKQSEENGRPVIRSFAGAVRYKRGDHKRWPFKAGAAEPRLIKPFHKYAREAEFRIVWSVNTEAELSPVHIQLADSQKFLSIIPYERLPERVDVDVPLIDDDLGA